MSAILPLRCGPACASTAESFFQEANVKVLFVEERQAAICTLHTNLTLPLHPPHFTSTPQILSFSLFSRRTGLPFVRRNPETQAVPSGNIFHSLGPTEALAATRYGSFQSLVLLGKYGSLWTGPLCCSMRWWRRGVGKDGCR